MRTIVGKDMDKSLWLTFLEPSCILYVVLVRGQIETIFTGNPSLRCYDLVSWAHHQANRRNLY